MKKKFYITLTLCAGISLSTQAQFGGLKGLVGKKDKPAETQAASGAATKSDPSAGNIEPGETATDNIAANPKAWTVEFDKNIDWFKLNSSGKLIAAANDALYGVDPATGKVIWKLPQFKNLGKENYHIIPGSPYVAIVTGGMLSMHHVIIDVTDGRIVADTKDLGIKYVNRRYVAPSLNGIIFSGVDNKGLALMMIDVNSGKKLWTLQNIFESNSELLTAKPLAVDGQHIMLSTTKRVYKVNTAIGNVVWKSDFKTEADKLGLQTEAEPEEEAQTSTKDGEKKGGGLLGMASKVPGIGGFAAMGSMGSDMRNGMAKAADVVYGKFMVIDNMPGTVYYYNTRSMTAFDLASGTQTWTPVKFSDPVSKFILDDRGFLIATNDKNAELILLDRTSGQQKWEPVKLSGNITAIKLTGNNLAVASAKESGKNMVNVININTGKPLSASALKVSGTVSDIRMINKGLVYRTTQETNIQDINSGKDLWPSSLSYKNGGLGLDKGDQTYIWASGKLYVLSHNDGTYKPLGKGVKFGGDEQATAIELREKGILVSSDQNLALFDFDGNLTYHVYQKAPGISTFGKIMNAAAIGISVTNSASHGYQSGASGGQTTSTGRSEMEKADRWGSIGSAAASDMSRRFKASQAADSYQVILTKVTTATDSGIGLVRVNKDTGKIEAKVVLDDKKPDYIADEVDNLIFYKEAGNRITGYKL